MDPYGPVALSDTARNIALRIPGVGGFVGAGGLIRDIATGNFGGDSIGRMLGASLGMPGLGATAGNAVESLIQRAGGADYADTALAEQLPGTVPIQQALEDPQGTIQDALAGLGDAFTGMFTGGYEQVPGSRPEDYGLIDPNGFTSGTWDMLSQRYNQLYGDPNAGAAAQQTSLYNQILGGIPGSPQQVNAQQVSAQQIGQAPQVGAQQIDPSQLGGQAFNLPDFQSPQLQSVNQIQAPQVNERNLNAQFLGQGFNSGADIPGAQSLVSQAANAGQQQGQQAQQVAAGYDPNEFMNQFLGTAPQLQGLVQGATSDLERGLQDQTSRLTGQAVRDVANEFSGLGALYSGAAQDVASQRAMEMAGNVANQLGSQQINMFGNLAGNALNNLQQSYQAAPGFGLEAAGLGLQGAGLGLQGAQSVLGSEQAVRGQDIGLYQGNQGNQLQAGIANQNAGIAADQMNTGNQMTAQSQNAANALAQRGQGIDVANMQNQYNLAGAGLGMDQYGVDQGNLANILMSNQNAGLQSGGMNQDAWMRSALANQDAGLRSGIANQDAALRAALGNQGAGLQADQIGLSAMLDLYGMGQQGQQNLMSTLAQFGSPNYAAPQYEYIPGIGQQLLSTLGPAAAQGGMAALFGGF
jgi:hypothetical protein